MLDEVLELTSSFLNSYNISRARILDGTLGLGGYSQAMLEKFHDSNILGLDRDEQAINFSRERLRDFVQASRFHVRHGDFGSLDEILNIDEKFNVFVFDLGISNMQLSLPERGFSFQNDGPLDMRMNNEDRMTAAEILNTCDEKTLAKIFWEYGEERYSRLIARAVKNCRYPLKTTNDLVKLIRDTLPQPVQRKMGTHPARRVFQALRICVNNEKEELEKLLASLPELANREEHSLILFVAYHSIEDRLVKIAFREWHNNIGKIITRHPLMPSQDELERNYKSRSAKLRAFCTSKH